MGFKETYDLTSRVALITGASSKGIGSESAKVLAEAGAKVFLTARREEQLQAVCAEIEAAGGIVGHIKAFASQDDAFAHASVTEANRKPDLEGDVAAPFGPDADIQLVAIALLLDEQTLISICKRVVSG